MFEIICFFVHVSSKTKQKKNPGSCGEKETVHFLLCVCSHSEGKECQQQKVEKLVSWPGIHFPHKKKVEQERRELAQIREWSNEWKWFNEWTPPLWVSSSILRVLLLRRNAILCAFAPQTVKAGGYCLKRKKKGGLVQSSVTRWHVHRCIQLFHSFNFLRVSSVFHWGRPLTHAAHPLRECVAFVSNRQWHMRSGKNASTSTFLFYD